MKYPNYIDKILDKLKENNFSAYIVGGSVRDFLCDIHTEDFDIATNALPSEIKEIFSNYNPKSFGEKYGTINIFFDNKKVEITTFRKDGSYINSRFPKEVVFTSELKDDLIRRDFTINSLAYSKEEGIVDLFGGADDIKNKVIQTIRNSDDVFKEDALRILRAIRFSSVLGFEIEENTLFHLKNNLNLLKNISKERIQAEFVKILLGKNVKETLIKYPYVFDCVAKELHMMKDFSQNNPYHIYDILEHTANVVENTKEDAEIRLAAFFHDTGKVHTYSEKNGIGHFYNHSTVSVDITKKALKDLKFDNKTIDNVVKLVKYHDYTVYPDKVDVKRWLALLGKDLLAKLLDLQKADNIAKSQKAFYKIEMAQGAERFLQEIVTNNECYSISQLDVDGNDLQKMGIYGKNIGKALNFALENVIDDSVENKKDKLLLYIQENFISNKE